MDIPAKARDGEDKVAKNATLQVRASLTLVIKGDRAIYAALPSQVTLPSKAMSRKAPKHYHLQIPDHKEAIPTHHHDLVTKIIPDLCH